MTEPVLAFPNLGSCATFYDRVPSQSLVDRIEDWATSCQEEHEGCLRQVERGHSRASNGVLPTRLSDVACTQNTTSIRLSEGMELDDTSAYVTLSHCWGGNLPFRLLIGNHHELRKCIDVDKLPQTFRDAVCFTRALGIRHL